MTSLGENGTVQSSLATHLKLPRLSIFLFFAQGTFHRAAISADIRPEIPPIAPYRTADLSSTSVAQLIFKVRLDFLINI